MSGILRQRTASSLEGASDGPSRNLKAHGGLGPLAEEVADVSTNYLWLGCSGVGVGVAWWLCRRRKLRPVGRRTILGRIVV